MNIEIKEASAGGEQILAKLHTEDGLNEESLADLVNFTKKDFDGIALGKRTIWFAYSSEEPVGTVQLLHPSRQPGFKKDRKTAELHFMKVKKSFMGKGVSRLLNDALEQAAKIKGFRQLVLEVEISNQHATDIYRHWGYSIVRESHVDFHSYTMAKSLEILL